MPLDAIGPPAPSFFRDSFFRQVGKDVRFKPDTPFTLNHDLLLKIIRDAGFDPDNLSQYGHPEDGWRLTGIKKPEGLLRRVWRLGQHLKRGARHLIRQWDIHRWVLTKAGIEHARKLCGMPGRNLTATYLEERIQITGGLTGSLWQTLRSTVSAKLPISAAAGIVDDHIQTCLMHLIARDSLREKIITGKKIPDTLLATYAVRTGLSDIRDMGTNPVTRERLGARTERERAKGVILGPLSDARIVWAKDEIGQAAISDIAGDPLADGSVQSLDEWEDFQTYMACIEQVILKKKPKAVNRYLGVIRMRVSGFTISEIAEQEGVTTYQAAAIVAEARRCLQEARKKGSLLFATT